MPTERPAITALRKAGWRPNRSVDITRDQAAYAKKEIPLFDTATEFLREFSGLVIRFERPHGPDMARFAGRYAAGVAVKAWVEHYSERAGVQLAPMGTAYREYLLLLIGADGSWYGGYDNEFGWLGANFLDALEDILLSDEFARRL